MRPEIKNRSLNWGGGGRGGIWHANDLRYTAADFVSVQAAISFMYLANQVKINVFIVH